MTERAFVGDNPPLTAAKTIQVYVSRLRKVLGAEILETRGRGYRLAVDPGGCDLDRFDSLLAQDAPRSRRAIPGGRSSCSMTRSRCGETQA